VPEISESTVPVLNPAQILAKIKLGQATVGKEAAVPMVVGPVTIARLAKLSGTTIAAVIDSLLPLYVDLLTQIKALGVSSMHSSCFKNTVNPFGVH
jgi:5-methyltetrahydropteroyltriglutamate--homocysteine methyltransferase